MPWWCTQGAEQHGFSWFMQIQFSSSKMWVLPSIWCPTLVVSRSCMVCLSGWNDSSKRKGKFYVSVKDQGPDYISACVDSCTPDSVFITLIIVETGAYAWASLQLQFPINSCRGASFPQGSVLHLSMFLRIFNLIFTLFHQGDFILHRGASHFSVVKHLKLIFVSERCCTRTGHPSNSLLKNK